MTATIAALSQNSFYEMINKLRRKANQKNKLKKKNNKKLKLKIIKNYKTITINN